jgi:plasmid stabilization system protein ParE
MRSRSIPPLLRTIAIFLASVQATGVGAASASEARGLGQPLYRPALRADSPREAPAFSRKLASRDRLLVVAPNAGSPNHGETAVRTSVARSVTVPARRDSTKGNLTLDVAPGRGQLDVTYAAVRLSLAAGRVRHGLASVQGPARTRAPCEVISAAT